MITDKTGISFAQFFDLMECCGPNSAVLLEGDTGIGKTTISRYFAEKIVNLPFCVIQVSENTDMTDVFGLPDFDSDHTIYKPPSWYLGPDVKCVLLLDEVNRNKTVMKGLMRLATDHRIGDLTLPDGSYVLGAINPEYGSLYQVVEMDPAHRARFQVAQLNPTMPEWVTFAEQEGLPPVVIEYIKSHELDLDTFKNDANVHDAEGQYYHHVLPCRRQWHMFAEQIIRGENFKGTGISRFDPKHYADAENFMYAMAAGRVGTGVAERFTKFYYKFKFRPDDCWITAENLLFGSEKDWEPKGKMVKELRRMAEKDIPGITTLGEELMDLTARNEDKMWNDFHSGPSSVAKSYGINIYKFLHLCPDEVVCSLYYAKIAPANREAERKKALAKQGSGKDDGPKWEKLMCLGFPKLNELLKETVDND